MTIDISTVPKPTNGRVLDETSDAIDEGTQYPYQKTFTFLLTSNPPPPRSQCFEGKNYSVLEGRLRIRLRER